MPDGPPDDEARQELKAEAEKERRRRHLTDLIRLERHNQIRKWGDRTEPENARTAMEWMGILGEEFGELSEQCVERHFAGAENLEEIENEAIQTAAVALAIAESARKRSIPAKERPGG